MFAERVEERFIHLLRLSCCRRAFLWPFPTPRAISTSAKRSFLQAGTPLTLNRWGELLSFLPPTDTLLVSVVLERKTAESDNSGLKRLQEELLLQGRERTRILAVSVSVAALTPPSPPLTI